MEIAESKLIGKSRAMPRLERVSKLYIQVSYFKKTL